MHAFIIVALSFLSDMPLERKTPVQYPDGTYEIVQESMRANALLVSNISQHGLSGLGGRKRTALFTFFGEYPILVMYTDTPHLLYAHHS